MASCRSADRDGRSGTGSNIFGMVCALVFGLVAATAIVGNTDLSWLLHTGSKFAFAAAVAVIGLGLLVSATRKGRADKS